MILNEKDLAKLDELQRRLYGVPKSEGHMGPGPHPGTGTEQQVHAGDGADVATEESPFPEYRKLVDDAIDNDRSVELPNNPHVRVYINKGTVAWHGIFFDRDKVAAWLAEADSFDLPAIEGAIRRYAGRIVIESISDFELRGQLGHAIAASFSPEDDAIYINYDLLSGPMENWATDGFLSGNADERSVIAHEVGHVMHDAHGDINAIHDRHPEHSDDWRKIAGEVSRYAQTMPVEFVAEVFSAVRDGVEYSGAVMDLYDELDGPPIPMRE